MTEHEVMRRRIVEMDAELDAACEIVSEWLDVVGVEFGNHPDYGTRDEREKVRDAAANLHTLPERRKGLKETLELRAMATVGQTALVQ